MQNRISQIIYAVRRMYNKGNQFHLWKSNILFKYVWGSTKGLISFHACTASSCQRLPCLIYQFSLHSSSIFIFMSKNRFFYLSNIVSNHYVCFLSLLYNRRVRKLIKIQACILHIQNIFVGTMAVSYTHLTLPTKA